MQQKQSSHSRIQILVLPNTRGELSDDPRVQNQVVDEAQVTLDTKQGWLSNLSSCDCRTPVITHIHPSQEKCRAWVRGSSAKTECCCQKDADVCSILWRNRAELITADRKRRTGKVTEKTAATSVPETRVLRTRRNWGAATAYLQSRNRRWGFLFPSCLHCVGSSWNRISNIRSTHTGAAASHHSGLPGCRTRCKEATPDQGYMRARRHEKGGLNLVGYE